MGVTVHFMRRLLYVMGVAALASLAACGDPSLQQPAGAAPEATAVSAAPAATVAVPASLAFSAARVGGGTINLADYAGTPVLLWFWAPT